MKHFPYDVFLSHRIGDNAHELRDQLVSCGCTVWFDENRPLVERRLFSLIQKAHAESRVTIAYLSPGHSPSPWTVLEMLTGMTVDEIDEHYRSLGDKVFKRSFWRRGMVLEKYDAKAVAAALSNVLGTSMLKDAKFRTGLLIVAKRLDTGSTWVMTNNPNAKYFPANPERPQTIPNGEYPLWQIVRASTAAPTYFAGEEIRIHSDESIGRKDTVGLFIDGGCSPHNNPSLQALMVATMDGYRFGWPAGADKLLLVSVGTGKADAKVDLASRLTDTAAAQAVLALKNLMEDCGDLVETILQWISAPTPTARFIDREMGLAGPVLGGGGGLLTYHRYNALFTQDWFDKADLGIQADADYLASMQEMERPENLDKLRELGEAVARTQVDIAHFPALFDSGVRVG